MNLNPMKENNKIEIVQLTYLCIWQYDKEVSTTSSDLTSSFLKVITITYMPILP